MGLSLKYEAVAERHRIFATHYARSGNGSSAARAAGYKRRNEPARLLARLDVQRALAAAHTDPTAIATVRFPIISNADTRRFHFACKYLELGLCGTTAARTAGYASPRCSASVLLKRDDVRQWIARLADATATNPECAISKSLARLYTQAKNPDCGVRASAKLAKLNQICKEYKDKRTYGSKIKQ